MAGLQSSIGAGNFSQRRIWGMSHEAPAFLANSMQAMSPGTLPMWFQYFVASIGLVLMASNAVSNWYSTVAARRTAAASIEAANASVRSANTAERSLYIANTTFKWEVAKRAAAGKSIPVSGGSVHSRVDTTLVDVQTTPRPSSVQPRPPDDEFDDPGYLSDSIKSIRKNKNVPRGSINTTPMYYIDERPYYQSERCRRQVDSLSSGSPSSWRDHDLDSGNLNGAQSMNMKNHTPLQPVSTPLGSPPLRKEPTSKVGVPSASADTSTRNQRHSQFSHRGSNSITDPSGIAHSSDQKQAATASSLLASTAHQASFITGAKFDAAMEEMRNETSPHKCNAATPDVDSATVAVKGIAPIKRQALHDNKIAEAHSKLNESDIPLSHGTIANDPKPPANSETSLSGDDNIHRVPMNLLAVKERPGKSRTKSENNLNAHHTVSTTKSITPPTVPVATKTPSSDSFQLPKVDSSEQPKTSHQAAEASNSGQEVSAAKPCAPSA